MRTHFSLFRSYYQITLAAITVVALVAQFGYGLMQAAHPGIYTEQFFSYFTILSNLLVAGIFTYESVRAFQQKRLSSGFDSLRGATVFCIIVTGTVYALFLRGGPGHMGQVEYSLAWVNDVFHYVVPSLVALDWLLFPPTRRINWSTIFSWFGLTLIYVVLVELGGLVSHTYPYFFLNPTMFGGYQGVLRASAAFLPFFLVFGVLVIGTANIQYRVRKKFARTL